MLDVFIFKSLYDKVVYESKMAREIWPKDWIKQSDVENLQFIPFGDFLVPVINNPERYCRRLYGKDWKTHINWQIYNHEKEKEGKYVSFKLSETDKEAAQPTNVKNINII